MLLCSAEANWITGQTLDVDVDASDFWDAVILASPSQGGCRLLLTEDLQEGFTWNGVTVTNPFAKSPHPLP